MDGPEKQLSRIPALLTAEAGNGRQSAKADLCQLSFLRDFFFYTFVDQIKKLRDTSECRDVSFAKSAQPAVSEAQQQWFHKMEEGLESVRQATA